MAYDGFYLTYKSDKETNERFDKIQQKYPNFRMVKINLEDWADPKLEKAITKIATVTNTKHFWVIDPDVKVDDDFNFGFETTEHDNYLTHVWNCEERNVFRSVVGVKLFKTKDVKKNKPIHITDAYYLTGEYKEHKSAQVNYTPTTESYDIFFWDKGYGYNELEKLKEKYTVTVITGDNSVAIHEQCRELAKTEFYYLVMPNTKVYDSFKFNYSFAFGLDKTKQKVVVWQKENPHTNLSREYHGVGLFPASGPLFSEKEYDIFNFRRKAVYEKEPISCDLEFEQVRATDLHTFGHKVDSDMYWLVHEDIEDFNPVFYPFSYDRDYIHNFNVKLQNGNIVRNGVRLVPTIDPDVEKQKDVDEVIANVRSTKSKDIFFWDKGYGHNELAQLQSKYDVQIVKGNNSVAVHELCREKSSTNFYYLVMPDTKVYNSFNFDYEFQFGEGKEKQGIVLWQKENPATNLTREYHGVGLFPRDDPMFSEKAYDMSNFRRKATYIKEPISCDMEFEQVRTTDLHTFGHNVDSDMYWLIHEDVEDFSSDFYPFSYDRDYIHNFNVKLKSGKVIRNGVRLVPTVNSTIDKQKDIDTVVGTISAVQEIQARTIEEAIPLATGHNFWMINPDLTPTTSIVSDFYPDLYETGPTHLWKQSSRDGKKDLGYGGIAYSNVDYHPENIIFHDEYSARVPDKHNIKTYYTRDPYSAYTRATKEVYYWVVDTVVELLDTFDFDFYPDIFSIENVFAFKSEGEAGSGVYLVHRPHLASFNPSEEDFSFDRFKNIIRVDEVVSRVVGHPVFYFDEGMYSENTEKYKNDKTVEVLTGPIEETYLKAAKLTKTGYFWAIDNDVEVLTDFDRTLYVDRHHKSYFHVWPKENPYTGFVHQYGGLKLIPAEALLHLKPSSDKLRKMSFKNKKPIQSETVKTRDIPYDVVMLSYQEKEADANYAKLLERVPNAKRVHGVKGIFNAHKRAAEIADTKMFYVIDADAILLDDFKFEYFPTVWDENTVHVWKSKNPINGLVYGFGGLKLFPTQLLRDVTEWRIDFTTSISEHFKPMPATANYTAFNTNPYDTWKSAFRECTKLSSSVIHRSKQDETDERLEIWCTINNDAKYGEYSIAGANAGREYGTANADNDEALGKINDYEWLHQKFEENTND